MAKFLISTVETYRVDTEAQVQELISDAKANPYYQLSKYSSQKKEKKAKGEVIDDWYHVTLTKVFDDEKDPYIETTVEYKSAATIAQKEGFTIDDDEG